jgi:hypothetical protein
VIPLVKPSNRGNQRCYPSSMPVQRPGDANDPTGKDLLAPSTEFLKGLRLLPLSDATKEVVDSQNVVSAHTFEITKQVKTLITWGGAGGAGASIIGAVVAGFKHADVALQIALVASAAIVLAAAILGLARVMDGDVRGRAAATVAQLEARRTVATALLTDFSTKHESTTASTPTATTGPTELQLALALAAPGNLKVTTDQSTAKVTAVRYSASEGLEVQLAGGDFVKASRVKSFETDVALPSPRA